MGRAERRHRTLQKQQSRINRLRFCHGHEIKDTREVGRLKDTPPGGEPRCAYKGDMAIPIGERRRLVLETDIMTLKKSDIHGNVRTFISDWFENSDRATTTEELRDLKGAFEDFKVTGDRIPSMRWSYKGQELWDLLMEYHK